MSYVQDVITNEVYELIAEHGDWYWLEHTVSGTLRTTAKTRCAPYTPAPQPGETWSAADGSDMIVFGETADGKVVALPKLCNPGDVVQAVSRDALVGPKAVIGPAAMPLLPTPDPGPQPTPDPGPPVTPGPPADVPPQAGPATGTGA